MATIIDKNRQEAKLKSKSLTARQQEAAFLLASGRTSGTVVQEMKIHRATLANWQKFPEFEAYLNQLLKDGRSGAHAKMITLGAKAASTIEDLLDSKNERIRLAAASEIIRRLSEVNIGSSSVGAIESDRRLSELARFSCRKSEEGHHGDR